MAETLSIQEIQVRYDGEWVLIGDPEVDASLFCLRAPVSMACSAWISFAAVILVLTSPMVRLQ